MECCLAAPNGVSRLSSKGHFRCTQQSLYVLWYPSASNTKQSESANLSVSPTTGRASNDRFAAQSKFSPLLRTAPRASSDTCKAPARICVWWFWKRPHQPRRVPRKPHRASRSNWGHRLGDTNLIREGGIPLFINGCPRSVVCCLRHRPDGVFRRGRAVLRDGHWSNAETSVSALTKWHSLSKPRRPVVQLLNESRRTSVCHCRTPSVY